MLNSPYGCIVLLLSIKIQLFQTYMFSEKNKRKMKIFWSIVSVVIVIMMIALYMPVLFTR